MFGNVYRGKKVLVTGHTGFKGTWLTAWLVKLGAKVCGLSDEIPTSPSMFLELKLSEKIEHNICDIRNLDEMYGIFKSFKPDFVFHLAAQAIVSTSYSDPVDTISTNVMGTVNVLECLRRFEHRCSAVFITSDKCYENVEWVWGYKETDALGGRDIYSGSKGAAEVVLHSYIESFFRGTKNKVNIATGRAGNVIGGGDWARDRIVVDCMKSWANKESVEIRSPSATRPWQHVLEPLSGYLTVGKELSLGRCHGESFNFGPRSEQNRSVLELLTDLSSFWDFKDVSEAYNVTDSIPFHEAGLLKLNCDKALFHLSWEANLLYKECVRFVSEWYYSFYMEEVDMLSLTLQQIKEYEDYASIRKLTWAV